MKPWQALVFGILIGLLAAGIILLVSKPQYGVPITLNPAPTTTKTQPPVASPTTAPIQVQIKGEIKNPGVYTCENISRLGDLVAMAGGFTGKADLDQVNLAAVLRDGDYFYIPGMDENLPDISRNSTIEIDLESEEEFEYPLNLNTATQAALESLPGIGPVKAAEIIAYREKIGAFFSIEELLNVKGIGPATLESIREYLVIVP